MKLVELKKELADSPFKTVFKATVGFYVAQLAVTILGLLVFGGIFTIGVFVFSSNK
jgi:hypothetical protein